MTPVGRLLASVHCTWIACSYTYIYICIYQVESLRVADASIMPAMPGAQLGATLALTLTLITLK